MAWKAYDLARKQVRQSIPTHWTYSAAAADTRRVFERCDGGTVRQYLLTRRHTAFLWDQSDVDSIIGACASYEVGYGERIVRRAEAVISHQLPVLSVGPMPLGEMIDWHKDYRSGLRWPLGPSATTDFLDFDRPTDVRIVWELNRLHFLVDLGKAYRVTGDHRYAEGVMELVADWDRSNPVGFGVNWTCAMEAAIRIVNVIWALELVLPSAALDDRFLGRTIEMLLEHGIFVRQNLEYSDVRGNHYLSDLVGLAWIGFFLPESAKATDWLSFALPRIEAEISHQVDEDGTTHEGSIPYHRLVMELFLAVGLLAGRNARPFPATYWARLSAMADFVAAYTRPDGQCPMFGDTDDGRLHVLGAQPVNDHRYLLAVIGACLNRPDLEGTAGGPWEEAAWLLGRVGLSRLGEVPACPPRRSQAFDRGGWYFLRGKDAYVAVDCGDVGLRGQGGHGHADMLSFEASFHGEPVIVDRGSGLYTASREKRREDLAPSAHNLVIVDGDDYAQPFGSGFVSAPTTPGRLIDWHVSESRTAFEGEHGGYLSKGIVHRRRIELDHASGRVSMRDRLLGHGDGLHLVSVRFHLASHMTPQAQGARLVLGSTSGLDVVIEVDPAAGGTWELRPTTVYHSYGAEDESVRLEWNARMELPAAVIFTLHAIPPNEPDDRRSDASQSGSRLA